MASKKNSAISDVETEITDAAAETAAQTAETTQTAEATQATETVAEAVATTQAAEKKFPLERLKAHSNKLFGVSPIVFAGAITGVPDGEYSVSEITEIIEAWSKKEAK